TYNHENYIEDAVEGFLNQETDFPFEIIIHDDASTDSTKNIITQYARKYKNIIRLILQEENQYSKGRRIAPIAIKQSRAKYIALCDGDDYWVDPHKLQKQVTFLEENPDYVLTYHNSQPFDETGDLNINFGGALRDLESTELQRRTPIFTLTTCFRNVITAFPPEMAIAKIGDLFLWSLLGQYGKGKYLGDITPARYRVHDNSMLSKKNREEKIKMHLMTNASLFAYYSRISNNELANLILKLKHLSEKKKTIINFQNIEEVILLGNPKSNYIFNFYLVILYTLKLKGKQQGYLIGNVKKWGYLLIGVWPFNIELSTITEDDILKNLKDIVNNLTKYSKICLISQ
ncbi:hypothetical protein LCGC14_1249130, partial [marine sediment metagenome]